jgi:hypothetical protein
MLLVPLCWLFELLLRVEGCCENILGRLDPLGWLYLLKMLSWGDVADGCVVVEKILRRNELLPVGLFTIGVLAGELLTPTLNILVFGGSMLIPLWFPEDVFWDVALLLWFPAVGFVNDWGLLVGSSATIELLTGCGCGGGLSWGAV